MKDGSWRIEKEMVARNLFEKGLASSFCRLDYGSNEEYLALKALNDYLSKHLYCLLSDKR